MELVKSHDRGGSRFELQDAVKIGILIDSSERCLGHSPFRRGKQLRKHRPTDAATQVRQPNGDDSFRIGISGRRKSGLRIAEEKSVQFG